jgi:adenosylcobinamide-phosphate synthase
MSIERIIEYPIAILLISLLVDAIIGDPNTLHPVRGIGVLIEKLEPFFYRMKNKVLGGSLLVFTVSFTVLLVLFATISLSSINYILFLIISALILKSTFALKSMKTHINPVIISLKKGDIDGARVGISRIVRRDVSGLQEPLICSAAIESISEGFVDGYANSILFFSLVGLMGAMFTRIASTFDSMIGYNDERYAKFGRAAAYLDTAINFFPARLSALIFAVAAMTMGLPSWKSSELVEAKREVKSINAGWPMGSFALMLGVRLEKVGNYVINKSGRMPTVEDVDVAMRIFRRSSALYLLIAAFPILLIMSSI